MRNPATHMLIFVLWIFLACALIDRFNERSRLTPVAEVTPVKITPVTTPVAQPSPTQFAIYNVQGILCAAPNSETERRHWGRRYWLLTDPAGYPPCE